ncbi:hypothetical protein [Acidipropionibacterium virtanenii]|uniref:hypothetical protein n=1 Tax=Acidipropionibacterium virtanenii TaxID=2057246 RepID=UPI0011BF7CB3|nr:hypothetical protein [Acidipropionibacterium virtanenii]
MDIQEQEPSPAEATQHLTNLVSDRRKFADDVSTPWPIRCSVALVMAFWVAESALNKMHGYDSMTETICSALLPLALLSVLVYLVDDRIGIRARRLGAIGTTAVVIYGAAFGWILTLAMEAASHEKTWTILWLCIATLVVTIGMFIAVEYAIARKIKHG